MRARKTDTEIRREQIAQAAMRIVERYGLRGLSVKRVANAVGVVPSGLYRHFAGKDGVLDAVLDLIGARMQANVTHVRSDGGGALDRLRELMRLHIELILRNSAIPRIVFSEELLHGRATHRGRMYEIVRAYLGQVEQLVRDGQQEGCVRHDIDPGAASVLFLGLIQPAVVLWSMSGGRFDVRAHARTGWELFVRAICHTNQNETSREERSE